MQAERTSRTSLAGRFLIVSSIVVVSAVVVALVDQNRQLKAALGSSGSPQAPTTISYEAGDELPNIELVGITEPESSAGPRLLRDVVGGAGVAAFMTTTCPYCEEAIPNWQRLAEEVRADGYRFVAISLSMPDVTASYVREHGIRYPVWAINSRFAYDKLQLRAVPATLLLGEGASILEIMYGELLGGDIRELRERLLAVAPK